MEDISARIEREVGSWDGVTVDTNPAGSRFFRVGGRELGHIDARGYAYFPFTHRIREMLTETGRAASTRRDGWVCRALDDEVVELFRLAYERARVAHNVKKSRE